MLRASAHLFTLLALIPIFGGGLLSGQTLVDLFDEQNIQDISLTVDPQDWRTLKANYLEDTYYPADFQWNGSVVRRIGIKSRGSGSRSPVKPSLKLDFARYLSTQTFLKRKSFILRNMVQEAPLMREHLSMLFMARMGLPASRTAHARLYINGEYSGLFLLVEEIDTDFIADRFSDA